MANSYFHAKLFPSFFLRNDMKKWLQYADISATVTPIYFMGLYKVPTPLLSCSRFRFPSLLLSIDQQVFVGSRDEDNGESHISGLAWKIAIRKRNIRTKILSTGTLISSSTMTLVLSHILSPSDFTKLTVFLLKPRELGGSNRDADIESEAGHTREQQEEALHKRIEMIKSSIESLSKASLNCK